MVCSVAVHLEEYSLFLLQAYNRFTVANPVSEMTYTVSSGTLKTIPYHRCKLAICWNANKGRATKLAVYCRLRQCAKNFCNTIVSFCDSERIIFMALIILGQHTSRSRVYKVGQKWDHYVWSPLWNAWTACIGNFWKFLRCAIDCAWTVDCTAQSACTEQGFDTSWSCGSYYAAKMGYRVRCYTVHENSQLVAWKLPMY